MSLQQVETMAQKSLYFLSALHLVASVIWDWQSSISPSIRRTQDVALDGEMHR